MIRIPARFTFGLLTLLIGSALGLAATESSSYLHVSSFAPEYTEIRWEDPEFNVASQMIDGEMLSAVDIPGERVLVREGYPALPHVTRIYRIPNTGSVELVINGAEYRVEDNFYPVPARREEQSGWGQPLKSPAVYGVDEWYPPVVAEISAPKIFRDFRIVEVTLYPVQVNPVTRQARFYDNINADIVANDTPGENELLLNRRPSGEWAPMYDSYIENLDETALDDVDYNPGSYAIICKNNATALQWADSLKDWRERLGFTVTVEARDNWTGSTLLSFLQNAYTTWDPPLEFACLLGDVQGTWAIPTSPSSRYDHGFADLQGNDDFEEIGVGRLSVSQAGHFPLIFNKITAYERTPYMTDPSWFTRAFLYAGTANNVSSNEILMLWAADMFRNYTGVTTPQVSTHSGNVSNSLIGERLTEGVAFFLWRGTVVGEMNNSAASSMTSSTKLPIVLTITCGSGDYDQGDALNESWLLAGTATAPKGGVAGIGTATFNTHVPYNNTIAGGLAYAITNLGIRHIGSALSGAKAAFLQSFPGDGWGAQFTWWNNLMGDPGLSMWTDVPVVMDVTYPTTVNVGARRIRPQVVDDATDEPIADALVVVIKDGETFVKGFTDAGGFVDLPVVVNSTGIMTLTVSKRNHKPFLADINCVNSDEMVTVQTFAVDDDNTGGTSGNNDDQFNPGEIVDLSVTLRNFGTATTASNINATVTCDNPDVTVIQANSTYPSLSPGQQAAGNTAFRIQLAPTMLHEEVAKLTFEVSSSTGTAFSTVALDIQAGSAVYVSSQITGGNNNNRLDPGETANLRVTVRNVGGLAMNGVTATLISQYSLLSINDGTGAFGDIAINGTATSGASDFVVRANSVGYPGSFGNLVVILQTPSGFIDSVAFALPIGVAASTDPTGPDPYGYLAYDNVDVDYEFHRNFDWTDISASGVRLTHASADPGEQQPNGQTNSDVIALPFDFMFYGETYDTLTICSNGWAAFGDQGTLDMFRNYPIPGQQAPEAMMAPFWDDLKTNGNGDGVFYLDDQTNHRLIIEWNAVGAFAQSSSLDFQLILLDPAFYPTNDGNGIIIFQYDNAQSVTQDNFEDATGETIGIQAPRSTFGLQYRHSGSNAAGANGLGNDRAVVITTEKRFATGIVMGTVTDEETGLPVDGVVISLDGEEDIATTDVQGHYTMIDVEIGTYTVRATRFGYNQGSTANFVVEMDSTEVASFSLTHPEVTLSTNALNVNLPGDPTEQSFDIDNAGNGPLDFRISLEYQAENGERGNWATIAHENVTQETQDAQILGCAFDGDRWVVSGGSGPTGPNFLYYYDLNGNYIGSANQPTTTQFGYYDLAFDGEYIYGSTDGLQELQGVDYSGNIRMTVPCTQVSPARCIAYDAALDQFWVADYSTAIFCIDRQGNELHRFTNNLDKTGMAWYPDDPDGYKLYVFHWNTQGTGGTLVSKVHPTSGAILAVTTITDQTGDRAGGCDISSNWNSMLTVFGGIFQNSQGDRLEMRQMKFDTDWIGVTPLISSVLPQSSRDISVSIDPANLRDLTYHVNIVVHNNSLDSLVVLPLTLARYLVADEPTPEIPAQFAVYQNYPNPFNPSTQVRFDLADAGLTSLTIYNVLGQEVVAPIKGEQMNVGQHIVNVDMSGLPSGVYLYRVESGNFVETKKMVLMK
ncbi:MAG: carboxypeptidase regulatory-like domain-containing protein [bacterium]|nr:carboxypeptidase regulatory-like domain-containing protein [bacterium]